MNEGDSAMWKRAAACLYLIAVTACAGGGGTHSPAEGFALVEENGEQVLVRVLFEVVNLKAERTDLQTTKALWKFQGTVLVGKPPDSKKGTYVLLVGYSDPFEAGEQTTIAFVKDGVGEISFSIMTPTDAPAPKFEPRLIGFVQLRRDAALRVVG